MQPSLASASAFLNRCMPVSVKFEQVQNACLKKKLIWFHYDINNNV